jgi:hypothetical protein
MTLLYLVGDRTGVDEQGIRWVRDDDGSWQRGVEPRRAHLRLLRSEAAEEAPRRPAAGPARRFAPAQVR